MSHQLLLAMLAATTPEAAAMAPAEAQGVTPYLAAFFAEAQPNSAMDMIARIPGFSFDQGDQVRGYGGAAGNVLIDGQRPATKSEGLEDALRRIQASQVERIDIIRGGAPGIDMQGKTVIANVVLRKDKQGQWLFAVASGVFQDGRTTPAVRFEGSQKVGERTFEWSALGFTFVDDGAGSGPGSVVSSTGAVLREGQIDETGGGRGYTLKGGVKTPLLAGRASFNAKLDHEHYAWSLNDFISFPAPGRLQVNDDFFRDEGEVGANWERALGPKLKLEVTGLMQRRYTDFASSFDDGANDGLFTQENEAGETIARAVLRYTISPTWSVEGGGEVAFNYLDSALDYVENGAPVTLPASDVRVEERRGEVFGSTTWRSSPKLSFEAGLKVEVSTIAQSGDTNLEKTLTYLKPRASMTWSPTPTDQFRLRIEREVGQLDFGDFVSSVAFSTGTGTAGNADLEPDKTWVAEATYERKFWKDGALVLTYIHHEITDATDRVPIIGPGFAFDAPGNIGDGVSDNIRIGLTLPLARLGVPGGLLRANGEWSRSEVTDPVTGESRRISGQQPFEGDIRFSQDLPRLKVQWGVDAFLGFEERYYRFDQIETIELGTWVAAYAEYKPRPNLSFRVEMQNLLGRDFTRTREVYAGPRSTAGLDYVDRRPLSFDPFIYFRIRQTFG
ncbi:MAG: TonB-dependent receptor [Caulobacter sp.]|nr:TonB-dependent receptor [Caulobacter sp.]